MTTVDYLQIEGVVADTCKPYKDSVGKCTFKCDDPSKAFQKYYCSIGSLRVLSHKDEIVNELRTNGPLMMGLRVYEDFLNYETGVYEYVYGEMVGGHAMKLIGYGTDAKSGDFFWLLQNQWSDDWGEKGLIRIKAGEVGIDSIALSCMPDLEQARWEGLK